jgi:A/G-specific adenine glycosylase
MDLGATVCTRGDPRCGSCPVADCVAREQGRTAELPTARPAKALPERRQRYLLLRHSDDVLLVKRPAPGIWGGLWCLPEIGDDESALPALLRKRFGVNRIGDTRQLPDIVHTFTHFRLTLVITEVAVAGRTPVARDSGTVWLALADASGAALPKPISRLLISMSDATRIA